MDLPPTTATEASTGPGGPDSPGPPGPRRRSWAWLFGLLPILVVAGVVAGYLYWADGQGAGSGAGAGLRPTAPPQPATLVAGRDYYLMVTTLELYPQKPGGGPWDRLADAAPDIGYRLHWQDTKVFESPVREDTLVAEWDPISVDVREAILGGKLELASTLNQGAIVNVTDGGAVVIDIYDADAIGLGEDRAGTVTLDLAELHLGDNTLTFEDSTTNAVKRLVLRATDTDQPVRSLIEALSAPSGTTSR